MDPQICLISSILLLSNFGQIKTDLLDGIKFCNNTSDCGPHQVCDDICVCDVGYVDPHMTGMCELAKCQTDHDCHDNAFWRVCNNGQCVCRDDREGSNCGQDICFEQSYCKQPNTFCLEDLAICACNKNYRYDFTTRKCEKFECKTNDECYITAKIPSEHLGSVCHNGQCVCDDGYKLDDKEGGNICHRTSKTYHKPCNDTNMCWFGLETCVDGKCECAPNQRYDQDLGFCILFDCVNSTECQTYDPNRVCALDSFGKTGRCECRDDFFEDDGNSRKCKRYADTYGQECISRRDCSQYNQRCVDKKCICDHRSIVVESDGQKWCNLTNCGVEDICNNEADPHRKCDKTYGSCLCQSGYREDESNGDKCVSGSPFIKLSHVIISISLIILCFSSL